MKRSRKGFDRLHAASETGDAVAVQFQLTVGKKPHSKISYPPECGTPEMSAELALTVVGCDKKDAAWPA